MNVNWKKMCYAQKHLFKLQNISNNMRREREELIDCQYGLYLYKCISTER